MGYRLEPKHQTFEVHIPSWLYWLSKAVECGLAKVVKGELPDTIEGEPIKNLSWRSRSRQPQINSLLQLNGRVTCLKNS